MLLRWKFSILLAILLLALAVSVGTAVFSIVVFQRELAGPMTSIQQIMTELNRIKRDVQNQYDQLGVPAGTHIYAAPLPATVLAPMPPPQVHTREWTDAQRAERSDAVGAMRLKVRLSLDTLEAFPEYRMWIGSNMIGNLRDRMDSAANAMVMWSKQNDPQALGSSRSAMYTMHELIEAVESRMLETAGTELVFADTLRTQLFFILGVSTLAVVSAVTYAWVLVRRWILRPVGEIRAATKSIATGNFSHRIQTVGADEIAQLGTEVNHMSEMIVRMQTERIEQERLAAFGQMTQTIVHNLRNPLAGIRAIAELTQSELAETDAELSSAQERIITAVDRFESWLTSLLRSSSPLEIHPTDFDPRDLFATLALSMQASAGAKQISLVFEKPDNGGLVFADREQLEQALIAYIANAIEVSPIGANVRVGMIHLPRTPGNVDQIQFFVQDRGPGVDESLRARIFEPYFTTKQSGTGIGLALTKRVVQSHGGSAGVEPSDAGTEKQPGARFTLTIPTQAGTLDTDRS